MQVSRSREQLVHLCALCEHSCFLRCVSIGTANDEFGGHMQTVPRRRGNRRFPQEQVSRSELSPVTGCQKGSSPFCTPLHPYVCSFSLTP